MHAAACSLAAKETLRRTVCLDQTIRNLCLEHLIPSRTAPRTNQGGRLRSRRGSLRHWRSASMRCTFAAQFLGAALRWRLHDHDHIGHVHAQYESLKLSNPISRHLRDRVRCLPLAYALLVLPYSRVPRISGRPNMIAWSFVKIHS